MIVEIHGLEVFGRHGVNDDERRDGQTFLFDIEVGGSEPQADSIDATVDYRRIRDIVRETSDAASYQLLETLAARVADAIYDQLDVETVRVRVRKPGVTWAEWTGVTCERP
jgi:7,8-dihydroneopterin aldolase/epimerase/oxygenase